MATFTRHLASSITKHEGGRLLAFSAVVGRCRCRCGLAAAVVLVIPGVFCSRARSHALLALPLRVVGRGPDSSRRGTRPPPELLVGTRDSDPGTRCHNTSTTAHQRRSRPPGTGVVPPATVVEVVLDASVTCLHRRQTPVHAAGAAGTAAIGGLQDRQPIDDSAGKRLSSSCGGIDLARRAAGQRTRPGG